MRTGEEGRESGEQDKMIEMREDFKGKKIILMVGSQR